MRLEELQIDADRLADLCEHHGVARLELFGSFVRGHATPDSDLDVLVTFEPGSGTGLDIVAFQQALVAFFARPVDLLTRSAVERSENKYFRRFVLRRTASLYERG